MNQNDINELLNIPETVFGSKEWQELEQMEYKIGPENLLKKITEKKLWSNAEILWVLKRMIYCYGKKDAILKKTPVDRLFNNVVDILRAFYLVFDKVDPDLDDNIRSYICAKITDSTWGISTNTRDYLYKIKD